MSVYLKDNQEKKPGFFKVTEYTIRMFYISNPQAHKPETQALGRKIDSDKEGWSPEASPVEFGLAMLLLSGW
jgi:hypothetical protein